MKSEEPGTTRSFRVEGRVQGVGFRWWTQRTARALGLGGSVRNLADGTVEVHAVGPASLVARLAAALHDGPVGARVERVREIPPSGSVSGGDFEIRG